MEKIKRSPGADLAKIVAIFLVVMGHVAYLLPASTLFVSWVKALLGSIYGSCVDLFALATGYLCVMSKCRYSRLVSLWVTTVFWGVVMLLVCQFAFGFDVHFKYYLKACLPVLFGQYWFFTAYFLLFLCMPLINKGVLTLGKSEYRRLLSALLLFICIYSYSGVGHDRFHVMGGYSFLWLAVAYVFGAYIRLYWQKRISAWWYFGGVLLLAFLSRTHQMISFIVGFSIPGSRFGFHSYVSPFTFAIAGLIFMGCLSLEIKSDRICRVLKEVSALTFGIYLIHVQPFVWGLWCAHFKEVTINSASALLMFVVGTSIGAFLFLGVIEYMRCMLFAMLGIEKVISLVDRVLPRK